MAEGKTDFYAEIGLKIDRQQALAEARKLAKIQKDTIEKSLKEIQREQQKVYGVLATAPRGRVSFKNTLKGSTVLPYNQSSLKKDLSDQTKVYVKESGVWEKIKEKIRKKENDAFKKSDEENRQRTLARLKEARAEINRRFKDEETNRKNTEKAEKAAQKEKERLERAQKRKEEKQHRERVKRLKSLAKWTIGATAAGAYFAQRTINQSAERAFSFRNFSDFVGQEQYGNLRKFQAASKVFGNIGEKESMAAFKQLFEFRQKMRLGLGQNTNASRLLGINWAETDTRKLINSLFDAISRQDKGLQGILTKEVFGDERYLSVLKRFQENPQMVWDVEKEVERNSLTEQQIKDLDELRQVFAKLSLQTTNLLDQFSAVAATDLKDVISELSDVIQFSTKNIKSAWEGVKFLGKPIEKLYSAGKWIGEKVFKADVEADAFMSDMMSSMATKEKLDILKDQATKQAVSETNNNQKTINVNIGGVTVNKNEETQKVIHDAVFGSVQGIGEINNVYLQMPTLTGGN